MAPCTLALGAFKIVGMGRPTQITQCRRGAAALSVSGRQAKATEAPSTGHRPHPPNHVSGSCGGGGIGRHLPSSADYRKLC